MYRKTGKIIGILLIFSLLLFGCSSARQSYGNGGKSGDMAASVATAPAAPAAPAPSMSPEAKASGGAWASTDSRAVPPIQPVASSLPQADRKRIINADIQMQTIAFDEAVTAISTIVTKYNGYFENSSLYDNGYFTQSVKSRGASYSIRIPATQYAAFKQEILTSAHAVNVSESEQDVSEQFFDLESRLKTLRMQQDRYYSLLEKADVMEDIVTLEKALADVQYQIEQYTTNLQKLSGLVDYATIRINLNEVYKVDNAQEMPTNLGARLWYSLKNATKETINLLEDSLVGLVSLIPLLIILVPVVLVIFVVIRKDKKRKQLKAAQKQEQNQKEL